MRRGAITVSTAKLGRRLAATAWKTSLVPSARRASTKFDGHEDFCMSENKCASTGVCADGVLRAYSRDGLRRLLLGPVEPIALAHAVGIVDGENDQLLSARRSRRR